MARCSAKKQQDRKATASGNKGRGVGGGKKKKMWRMSREVCVASILGSSSKSDLVDAKFGDQS